MSAVRGSGPERACGANFQLTKLRALVLLPKRFIVSPRAAHAAWNAPTAPAPPARASASVRIVKSSSSCTGATSGRSSGMRRAALAAGEARTLATSASYRRLYASIRASSVATCGMRMDEVRADMRSDKFGRSTARVAKRSSISGRFLCLSAFVSYAPASTAARIATSGSSVSTKPPSPELSNLNDCADTPHATPWWPVCTPS
mmetsp:Transcript_5654/g.17775  ORF Transcript_5654/g.17775 Transcript_5654/m.17775 type:complete len:203 (+) Transcript_5654:416-1024(+)